MSDHSLQTLIRRLGRRTPDTDTLIEGLARFGYGARGFVYLSAGALTLLAALNRGGEATSSSAAVGWLAQQPFGKAWLVLLGLGLWGFVAWRAAQSVLDADHHGDDLKGILARVGMGASGLAYGLLATTVFKYLDVFGGDPGGEGEQIARNRDRAETVLALPLGQWLLVGVGLAVLALGVGNMVRAWREDFADTLACSPDLCRKLTPLARFGYGARGFAWLPLAAFIILAGLHEQASTVTSLGEALDALERQPGGSWLLGLTAAGFMAFGAFAFVEARWRRIRPPNL
jgi:hypothetical protein